MDDIHSFELEMIEELEEIDFLTRIDRRCQLNIFPRRNDMEQLDEYDFICRYCLQKETVKSLVRRIGPKLVSSTRNNAISSLEQVLIALRFYATGTFQIAVGDLHDISQPSCSRVVSRVSASISELSSDYIHLPRTESERIEISQDFFHLSGFPGVLGAVDCTHIPIQSPGGEKAETFRNRKGFFSINVQTVSDKNLLIRNIIARWPGSTHDCTIFENSHVFAEFETREIPEKYHLLGDNGYACKLCVMTPILNPQSDSEMRYNRSHIKARNTVERQYGIWKRHFPCLSVGLRCNLKNAMNIIVATAILHNIAILEGNVALPEENCNETSYYNDVPVPIVTSRNAAGLAKRNSIITDFFSS